MTYEIEAKVLREVPTAVVRGTVGVAELPAWLGHAFEATARHLAGQGAGPAGPPFSRYHAVGGDRFEVEAGFPAARPVAGEGEVRSGTLPAGAAAVTVHVGPYDAMVPAYRALLDWIESHRAHAAGDAWEVYLSEPGGDPATWRTEIVQPLRAA